MSLPTPTEISWADWSKHYKIATPTFQLTPIEKPDMSPLLVHMTSKNSILSILNGENSKDTVPPEHGHLKSSVPEYAQGPFKVPVVCFSESPTFALEFFRYRSIDRWRNDQRYGIGFDKTELVSHGVRPVLYVDGDSRRNLIHLYKKKDDGTVFSSDPNINSRLMDLLESLYPFIFPLLEDHNSQGFMWEREWRHPNPNGFTFPYSCIKVICCPANEEQLIRNILGKAADNIDFIRVWREYDDVTNYLRRQQPIWQSQSVSLTLSSQPNNVSQSIKNLSNLMQQYKLTLHSLESYEEFATYLNDELQKIATEKKQLETQIKSVQREIDRLNEQAKNYSDLI